VRSKKQLPLSLVSFRHMYLKFVATCISIEHGFFRNVIGSTVIVDVMKISRKKSGIILYTIGNQCDGEDACLFTTG
jgi:hypothetical protein